MPQEAGLGVATGLAVAYAHKLSLSLSLSSRWLKAQPFTFSGLSP